MKKIIIVTNIPAPYRVALYSYLNREIDEMKFYIIYTNESEGNRHWEIYEKELENSIILKSKVIRVRTKYDYRYIHIPNKIFKTLKELKPDAVIAMEYNMAALLSLCWCKLKKRKFIHLTDGTLNSEKNLNFIQIASRKIICRFANSFIASSTKAKEKLISWKVPDNKINLSLLTVDLDKFIVTEKKFFSKNIILYVGSFAERKGIDLLFEALSLVDLDYEVHIVGDGDSANYKKLCDLADKLNLTDKIVWCGYLDGEKLKDEYRSASVFVLPTREDCFGLVLLEALCSKTPIISSKYADGAYDVVSQRENGLIIDPYNKEEFAKAICLVLSDEYVRRLYSENCVKYLEKFSLESVSKGYIKAINSVIA